MPRRHPLPLPVAVVSLDVASSEAALSHPAVPDLLPQGVALAAEIGETNVTAQLGNIVSDPITIVVPTLQSITISPDGPSLLVGMSRQYIATGNYDNSTTRDMTSLVDWTSSNISAATFSAVPGGEGK